MNGVAVLTAVYDGYETIKPVCPQVDRDGQPLDVDWVMVTDSEETADLADDAGWRVVVTPPLPIYPARGEGSRRPADFNRAAKRPKIQPWLYTDADASVWIDGSYRITSPRFVGDVLALADPIAQFPHPWRDCLYDEATFSAGLAKYAGEPLEQQAAYYRENGHPEHWGLWAAGVIGRRHTREVRAFGNAWAAQTALWSFQDQVSEPFVLRALGLRPASLPGDHLDNSWLSYEGSARH